MGLSRIQGVSPERSRVSRAFSLLELLVVIAVTMLLLTILSPALQYVRESAREVACGSNLRQIGYGIALFLDDHSDKFPETVWSDKRMMPGDDDYVLHPEQMMMVNWVTSSGVPNWDGLGHLFEQKYVPDGQVFYCPSHYSDHSFARYADDWASPGQEWIYGNYHYRGLAPKFNPGDPNETPIALSKTRYETLLKLPYSLTLVADGMLTRYDYNHVIGNSMLKLDLSVQWYSDPWARDEKQSIYARLPEFATTNLGAVPTVWIQLDHDRPGNDGNGSTGGGDSGQGGRASQFLNRNNKKHNGG